jgi:hypothetical protein
LALLGLQARTVRTLAERRRRTIVGFARRPRDRGDAGLHPNAGAALAEATTSLDGGLDMHPPAHITRVIIFAVAVAAVVIVLLLTGSADDKAQPGSGGRVPVTATPTDDPR